MKKIIVQTVRSTGSLRSGLEANRMFIPILEMTTKHITLASPVFRHTALLKHVFFRVLEVVLTQRLHNLPTQLIYFIHLQQRQITP